MMISVKLLIDTKANKVLFAEASKDFVDFLFFLLSLPIGTVTKLLDRKSMAGSIKNLYKSFDDLNRTYLQPNLNKSILLNPIRSSSFANKTLLLMSSSDLGSSTVTKNLYLCRSGCNKGVGDYSVECPACGRLMTKEVPYITTNFDGRGYVRELVSYMISDDLCVTPLSIISSVSLLNNVNVSALEVKVGSEEGLELLRMSFQSTSVLTDVFLRRKKSHCVN